MSALSGFKLKPAFSSEPAAELCRRSVRGVAQMRLMHIEQENRSQTLKSMNVVTLSAAVRTRARWLPADLRYITALWKNICVPHDEILSVQIIKMKTRRTVAAGHSERCPERDERVCRSVFETLLIHTAVSV